MNISALACRGFKLYSCCSQYAETWLVPLVLLLARLIVAWAFFTAGQVKIASWDSTLFLFEYEYQVPLLPFEIAAYVATATELLLPPLLAIGLLARPVALVLFVFNAMAVISYPALWDTGFLDHQLWGFMLLTVIALGAGPLSADHIACRKYCSVG